MKDLCRMNNFFLRDLNRYGLVFTVLVIFAFVLYFPIINNSFASDDFKVMNRVGLHRDVLAPGFFRPLSDITLYLNYLLSQFNPITYYLTNILLHACCSFMIYCFCMKAAFISSSFKDKQFFAIVTSILFLTYPFHNESIAWIVGRASLLAAFFGIACLLVVVSDMRTGPKFFYAGLFYFVGLLAYESIFPIPAIVIILIWRSDKKYRPLINWTLMFSILLFIHFILRKSFSGGMTGDYGQDIFSPQIQRILFNILKISGRMFLPPSDNSTLLLFAFSLISCSFLAVFIAGIIKNRKFSQRQNEIFFSGLLLTSLIVPFAFSISTRTSEGDRLLYFPSMFLCMFLGYLLTNKMKNRIAGNIIILGLLSYNISFLEINNLHWKKASAISNTILSQMSEICCRDKNITIVNIPGEYMGAYILRVGFKEAMLLRNLDTSGIYAINFINHAEYMSLPSQIEPVRVNDTIYLGKSIRLYGKTLLVSDFSNGEQRSIEIPEDRKHEIWYWNKIRLKRLAR